MCTILPTSGTIRSAGRRLPLGVCLCVRLCVCVCVGGGSHRCLPPRKAGVGSAIAQPRRTRTHRACVCACVRTRMHTDYAGVHASVRSSLCLHRPEPPLEIHCTLAAAGSSLITMLMSHGCRDPIHAATDCTCRQCCTRAGSKQRQRRRGHPHRHLLAPHNRHLGCEGETRR
jgi:hypothetical protein